METNRLLIYSKLADINQEIEAIGKNQQNEQQKFKYRGIDDVANELHALFAKHRVIIIPMVGDISQLEKPTRSGGIAIHSKTSINYRFITEDGSFVDVPMVGEAMDNGDKGINKTYAIALKYALTQMFLIPTNDPDADPDHTAHQVGKAPQKPSKQDAANSNAEGNKPKRKPIVMPDSKKMAEWRKQIAEGSNMFKSTEELLEHYDIKRDALKELAKLLKPKPKVDITSDKLKVWRKQITEGNNKFKSTEELLEHYDITQEAVELINALLEQTRIAKQLTDKIKITWSNDENSSDYQHIDNIRSNIKSGSITTIEQVTETYDLCDKSLKYVTGLIALTYPKKDNK